MQPNTETRTNIHNATKYRKTMQILTMQTNTETHYKYTQCNPIQKCTANAHIATKYKNMLQILITQLNIETRSNNAIKCRHTVHTQCNEIQKHTANTYNKPNTEMRCKYSQCNKMQKHTAITQNTTKYKLVLLL